MLANKDFQLFFVIMNSRSWPVTRTCKLGNMSHPIKGVFKNWSPITHLPELCMWPRPQAWNTPQPTRIPNPQNLIWRNPADTLTLKQTWRCCFLCCKHSYKWYIIWTTSDNNVILTSVFDIETTLVFDVESTSDSDNVI